MNLSPAVAGVVKGVLLAVLLALCSYFENMANLQGVVNPAIAVVITALASGLESHLKAQSGGTTALFGAVKLK